MIGVTYKDRGLDMKVSSRDRIRTGYSRGRNAD